MKYTAVSVRQLDRKGKPWQARAKYKDVYGKWKELSKMLPDAKGKKDAQRIAKEWLDALNAEADLMPNAGKVSTVDKTYTEYLKHQLDTGEIEKSTYSNCSYIRRVKSKPFSPDFTAQMEAATTLYGSDLHFLFSVSDIPELFQCLDEVYEAVILQRADCVIREQMCKYSYLFTT